MNLKTPTDLCEYLDIKRPNASKFIEANLQVTVHEMNGKAKKLIDFDLPKNKKALQDYLELHRDGVAYRGQLFTRQSKKAVKQLPEQVLVPRGTTEPKPEPKPEMEVVTAKTAISKITTEPKKIKPQKTNIIRTSSDEIQDSNLPVERMIVEFSESLPPEKLKKYEKILSDLSKLGVALIPEYEAQNAKVYTDLQAKRIEVEKKRAEKQKIEIQIYKEEGRTIQTDMAKTAWSKYGDAAMTSFKQCAELLINSFALEHGLSNDDRSHYLNQLNESIFDGVEEQKKMGFQLFEQLIKDQTGVPIEKKN